jgi:hypothetical protein
MTGTITSTAAYSEQRDHDWHAFVSGEMPLADHWTRWEESSHGWRQAISFMQPVGLDYDATFEALDPLLESLRSLPGVDVPPRELLFLEILRLGYLMSTDIYWSQVETFYVNAAPRMHRLEPFTLRFGGIGATSESLYLGVDDGLVLREVRKQLRVGVPKAYEVLKADPLVTADGDRFIPRVDFAYFLDGVDRQQVAAAVEPHRGVQLPEVPVTHIKIGRISSDPQVHYPPLDVVAEIGLLGQQARKGYHN